MDGGSPDNGKREALRASTTLYLSKALCENESWDEGAIEARAETLLKIANELWPHPYKPGSTAKEQMTCDLLPTG